MIVVFYSLYFLMVQPWESNPFKDMCGCPYLQGLLLSVTTESIDRKDSVGKQPQGLAVQNIALKGGSIPLAVMSLFCLLMIFMVSREMDLMFQSSCHHLRGLLFAVRVRFLLQHQVKRGMLVIAGCLHQD